MSCKTIVVGITAVLACLASSVDSALAGPILPDAFYRQEFRYPRPGRYHFEEGSISMAEEVIGIGGADIGRISGSAASTGGLLPMAAIDIAVSGTGFSAIDGEAIAALSYSWAVEQIAGTPRQTARVRIHTRGGVSAVANGDAAYAPYYAMASIWYGSWHTFVAGVNPGVPSYGDSFDQTYTPFVGVNQVFTTNLTAYALVAASWHGGAGTARADAWVDPVIEIDPGWLYADNFRVVFSRGIGVAPEVAPAVVPEPAVSLLVGSGLAAIGLKTRRWRRR